jgi:hypothetical protein
MDNMFMTAMTMVLPWKIGKDFQRFAKKKKQNENFDPQICIWQENGFRELTLVCVWKLVLGTTQSVLQHFWSDHLLEHSKGMNEPKKKKKRSNDLERSKFCQQVQSFGCVPPWRRVTFKIWEMLKNASEVTVVPKFYFLNDLYASRAKWGTPPMASTVFIQQL